MTSIQSLQSKFLVSVLATFCALAFSAVIDPGVASAAPELTATSTTITSNNASTTLAKVGNTISFYVGLSGTPWIGGTTTINIFSMGSVAMISASTTDPSPSWTYSTTSSASWTEGPIEFSVTFGNTDGTATTTITEDDLTSSNVVFDKTAPSGYTVDMGTYVTAAASTSASFSFAGAQVGSTYLYYVVGSATTSGSGTITTTTHTVSGIDVSANTDGTLTLSAALTDPAGNKGATTTDTVTLETTVPGTPTVDVPAGEYTNHQTVTLSSAGATAIRWTTDGSTPTCSTGSTGVVTISEDTTLKAVGCDAAGNISDVATFEYDLGGVSGSGSSRRHSHTEDNYVADDADETVATLEARVQTLLAQLNALRASLGLGGTSVPTGTSGFVRDLTVGTEGEDVRALQVWLNAEGFAIAASGVGSVGNETTYFGELTRVALAKFQASVGITPAVGYFGPKTRAHIGAQ